MSPLVNDTTIQKVKEVLEPLFNKIGEGAEFAFSAAYQKNLVAAWTSISITILIFVVLCIVCTKAYRYGDQIINETSNHYDNEFNGGTIKILSTGLFLIVFIGLAMFFQDATVRLLAPDYYAIQTLMELVGKVSQ